MFVYIRRHDPETGAFVMYEVARKDDNPNLEGYVFLRMIDNNPEYVPENLYEEYKDQYKL